MENKENSEQKGIENNKIEDIENEIGISGGNQLTDLANSLWGRIGLACCREDVKNALTDEDFTNKLLEANDKIKIKNLFDKRGVKVSDSEVDFCYDQIIKRL